MFPHYAARTVIEHNKVSLPAVDISDRARSHSRGVGPNIASVIHIDAAAPPVSQHPASEVYYFLQFVLTAHIVLKLFCNDDVT